MSRIIYINGNYYVSYNQVNLRLTKTAFRRGEELVAAFPDSIDLKISNRCSFGCPFCHEESIKDGKILDVEKTKQILEQLPDAPIEIAIGGGDILDSFDESYEIINWLSEKGYQVRITLNYKDTLKYIGVSYDDVDERMKKLMALDGIGISIDKIPDTYTPGDLGFLHNTPFIYSNVVYHIIAGLFPYQELEELFTVCSKVLILGYKQWGRAKNTELPKDLPKFEEEVKRMMRKKIDTGMINVIAFDNLAVEQLHIKDALLPEEWGELYMGDEGSHSMYIDAVSGIYSRTSRDSERVSWDSIGLIDYFKSL